MERDEGEHRVAAVIIVEELICPIMRDVGSCDGVDYSNWVVWEESPEHAELASQLLTRSWGFFLPTSISSSPFNSSISIHVILNLDPHSSFACAYDPDHTFSLRPSPSFTSNHRLAFLPSLSLPPPSTLQLSHGSPPDFLHKLKGTYDTRPLFRGIFWSMGYQCLRSQIRTVVSVSGCSLCTVPNPFVSLPQLIL